MFRWLQFGPDYDATAPDALRLSRARLVLSAAICAVVIPSLGFTTPLVWLGVMWLTEFCLLKVLRQDISTRRALLRQRVRRIFASLFLSVQWVTLGAILWCSGDHLRVAGAALWIGVLLYVQASSSKIPAHFAVTAGPALAAMIFGPLLTRDLGAREMIAVEGATLLCVLYALNSAIASNRAHRELTAATKELIGQRELAEAANAAKSAFLAMMSHELRTPMNGVLGLARALQATSLDARQRLFIDNILESGDGLLGVLNDILDLTKIEAGKLEFNWEPTDLGALARQVFALFAPAAAAKGLAYDLNVDPALPAFVADPLRTRQVMINLLSNAVKFTDQGGVTLSLAPGPRTPTGQVEVIFTVTDSGVGFDDAAAARLFKPFVQGDASTARTHGGTGLGLAISSELVRRMGGQISAASRPGEGATFIVNVPLTVAEIAVPAVCADLAPADPQDRAPLSILVAEDNAINRRVAAALLEPTGWRLTFVEDGAQALEALRTAAFDLVLMDVHMPVMDGPAAVRAIRAGEAGRRDIPIIALTADAMSEDRQRFFASGFDGYVPKPIRPEQLLRQIAEVVSAAAPGEATPREAISAA
jgi:signal transduction histidine kinase/CheY-like chemotaxis protein